MPDFVDKVTQALYGIRRRHSGFKETPRRPSRVDDVWAMSQTLAAAACTYVVDRVADGQLLGAGMINDVTGDMTGDPHTQATLVTWAARRADRTAPATQVLEVLHAHYNIDNDVLRYARRNEDDSMFQATRSLTFVFRIPTVVALVVADTCTVDSLVLAPGGEDVLAARFRTLCATLHAGFAFSSLCTVADILLCEHMLAEGGEVFAVLPVPRLMFEEYCKQRFRRQYALQDAMSRKKEEAFRMRV